MSFTGLRYAARHDFGRRVGPALTSGATKLRKPALSLECWALPGTDEQWYVGTPSAREGRSRSSEGVPRRQSFALVLIAQLPPVDRRLALGAARCDQRLKAQPTRTPHPTGGSRSTGFARCRGFSRGPSGSGALLQRSRSEPMVIARFLRPGRRTVDGSGLISQENVSKRTTSADTEIIFFGFVALHVVVQPDIGDVPRHDPVPTVDPAP